MANSHVVYCGWQITSQFLEVTVQDNEGITIAGFAKGAYRAIFGCEVDVYTNPLTSWAQATVSREQSSFEVTKPRTLELLEGVVHTVYKQDKLELSEDLGRLGERLEKIDNISDFGREIREARPLLDKVFKSEAQANPNDYV